MRTRLLNTIISIIFSPITWPTKLKLCRMILDVGAHNRCPPILRFPPGARLLKSSNRFTAYNFYPTELKLDMMIPVINPHNRSKLDFSISSYVGGAVEGAPFEIFQSTHSLQFLCDRAETWQDDTRHQSAQSLEVGFSGFRQGALLGRAFWNFEVDSQPTIFIQLS